jgi:hypothetical protein
MSTHQRSFTTTSLSLLFFIFDSLLDFSLPEFLQATFTFVPATELFSWKWKHCREPGTLYQSTSLRRRSPSTVAGWQEKSSKSSGRYIFFWGQKLH